MGAGSSVANTPEAQAYLEDHGLPVFAAGLQSALTKQKPSDPWLFMMQHIARHRPQDVVEFVVGDSIGAGTWRVNYWRLNECDRG